MILLVLQKGVYKYDEETCLVRLQTTAVKVSMSRSIRPYLHL
jgi:hypothetical protein